MKVIISGRRMEPDERLKALIEKKLSKLAKFFGDDAQVKVTVNQEAANRFVMEVTVFAGGMIYRAEEMTNDAFAAIDKTVAAIERQIRRNKTRLEKRLRDHAFDPSNFEYETEENEEKEFNIVKTKLIHLKPMSAEEAVLQMNLLGHSFFLFQNAATDKPNVVYRRNDKNYALIEIE